MGSFNITATAQCWRCGHYLSSSDEDCDSCAHKKLQRYHFERITSSDVQIVWAINPIRAWDALHDQNVDDIIGWKLVETGFTSLSYTQMGFDVRDRDELRTPNRP